MINLLILHLIHFLKRVIPHQMNNLIHHLKIHQVMTTFLQFKRIQRKNNKRKSKRGSKGRLQNKKMEEYKSN